MAQPFRVVLLANEIGVNHLFKVFLERHEIEVKSILLNKGGMLSEDSIALISEYQPDAVFMVGFWVDAIEVVTNQIKAISDNIRLAALSSLGPNQQEKHPLNVDYLNFMPVSPADVLEAIETLRGE